MKRDKDLIRALLLDIEESIEVRGRKFNSRFELATNIEDDAFFFVYSKEVRVDLRDRDYNLIQMQKANLVAFEDELKSGDFRGGYVNLTPVGHDALDGIRDASTWRKIKEASPSEAYSIVKSTTTSVGAKALAAIMGIG